MTIMMAQQWQWLWQQCSTACSTGKNTAALAKITLIQVLLPACCCGTVSNDDNGTLQVCMMQTVVINCPYLKEQRLEIFENTFFKIFKVLTLPCRM